MSIPVNHNVARVLGLDNEKVKRIRGNVFEYRGRPIETRVMRSLRTACRKAQITYGMKKEGGFRFHDVRATVDTYMDAAGVRDTVRKTILGHSLQGMDVHYIRLKEDHLREGMDLFTTWLDAQIEAACASVPQTVPQEQEKGLTLMS